MAWNENMKAWASAGPKKAARRKGGRHRKRSCVDLVISQRDGWSITRSECISDRGMQLLDLAMSIAARL